MLPGHHYFNQHVPVLKSPNAVFNSLGLSQNDNLGGGDLRPATTHCKILRKLVGGKVKHLTVVFP